MKKAILPDLIIAGAPKSGTSSLFSWLADHPEVEGSTQKETYFLVDPGTHMYDPTSHVDNGLSGYQRFFSATGGKKLRLEATPGYMYYKTSLKWASEMSSAPTVLFLLREPSTQIYSTYNYFKNNWNWIPAKMNFAEFVEACEARTNEFGGNELAQDALINAEYVNFLCQWKAAIGIERMIVFLFEDFFFSPRESMASLSTKLGINPDFYNAYGFPRENGTVSVRSRALQAVNINLRSKLPKGEFYRFARKLYRSFNTGPAVKPSEPDRKVMLGLRERYVECNKHLAVEFGLDLSRWEVS